MEHAEPELVEVSRFLASFNRESDRGAALIAAAYVDDRLADVLGGFLADLPVAKELLSGFNAPLGTFSARAAAAFSLGLVEQSEFDEIGTIRKIRNEFAHRWEDVSFANGRVRDLAQSLPWRGPSEFEAGAGPRERFNFAATLLIVDLMWRTRLVRQEKRTQRRWPGTMR